MDEARRRLWVATGGIVLFVVALCSTTCGDFGLTWDEPVYRQSQIRAEQWINELVRARSAAEIQALLEPDTLLYHWVYGRFGINFHPPLAGILDLFSYETFGLVMKDLPARRMGAVLTYAGAIGLLFHFLSRRYGVWTGAIAAGTLLLTPRVFADGQIGATDAPGLLFWPATACAFWSGMYDEKARAARILTGVCLGLAFLVKPVAMLVMLPLVAWFLLSRLRPGAIRSWSRADWLDGLLTLLPLFGLLGYAFLEIKRLAAALPPPRATQLWKLSVSSPLPDWYLALPAAVWLLRRVVGRVFRSSRLWGTERPALETLAASLGLAPLVVWLGNPEWWRATWPRLAHYYALGMDRRGALPQMPVHYFGQSYLYSSPWESGWVWIAITTPLTLLVAEILGIALGLFRIKRDRLPLFFLLNAATLPLMRILAIPGHDGTRLMLPTFFFLAAFAGWGAVALGEGLARWFRRLSPRTWMATVSACVLIPPAISLVRIHPFEMSYYNAVVGGPVGAWHKGLELTYWYDALTPSALRSLNEQIPPSSKLVFVNGQSSPFDYFDTLQTLGQIRGDIRFGAPGVLAFPGMLLLTADAKADAISRLLFVLKPHWAFTPRQLDGARVLSYYLPRKTAIALTLQLLTDILPGQGVPAETAAKSPEWVRKNLPFLRRYWGDDPGDTSPLGVNQPMIEWAKQDPASLRAAAQKLGQPGAYLSASNDPDVERLLGQLRRFDSVNPQYSPKILEGSPWAIPLAVEILIRHPDKIRQVMLTRGYTDPVLVGGFLDREAADER